MRAAWWGMAATLFVGCDAGGEAACGADFAPAVAALESPVAAGGCLNAYVGVRASTDAGEALLTVQFETERSMAAEYAVDDRFEVDLASGRFGGLQVGEDLSQNGPCSHTPFEVAEAWDVASGSATMVVAEVREDEVLGVDVAWRDVVFGDGCVVPDGEVRGALVALDSE